MLIASETTTLSGWLLEMMPPPLLLATNIGQNSFLTFGWQSQAIGVAGSTIGQAVILDGDVGGAVVERFWKVTKVVV